MKVKSSSKDLTSTINHILQSNHLLTEYFSNLCSNQQQCVELIQVLLIEAINHRKQNLKKQHSAKKYHVAYVKHQRFLSPSQKQAVTPKVTEIIPVSPEKIVIFGKPKVRLDSGYGCVQHAAEHCHQIKYALEEQNKNEKEKSHEGKENTRSKEHIIDEHDQYLSPKNHLKSNQPAPNQNIQTISIKSPKSKKNYIPTSSKRQENLAHKTSAKIIQHPVLKSDKNIQISDSRQTNNGKCKENYEKIESKIKFLIDRDRKSKNLENKLAEQNEQIKKIQQRQSKLLLRQYEQQKQLTQKNKTHKFSNNKLQINEESSSDDNENESDDRVNLRLKKLKQKLAQSSQNIQHYEPSHNFPKQNYFKKERKHLTRTQKISTLPIYHMSSDSSSGSDNEEDEQNVYKVQKQCSECDCDASANLEEYIKNKRISLEKYKQSKYDESGESHSEC